MSSEEGVSGIGSSHVQLASVDRGMGDHAGERSMGGSKGVGWAFGFQGEAGKTLRVAPSETVVEMEMEALRDGEAQLPSISSVSTQRNGEDTAIVSPSSTSMQGQVELDAERERLFIHTRGKLLLPPLQSAPSGSQSAGLELEMSSKHRKHRSVVPLPVSPRSAHSNLGRLTETEGAGIP